MLTCHIHTRGVLSRQWNFGQQDHFHSVDCVIQGVDAAYHFEQCSRIITYQCQIAGKTVANTKELAELFERADRDVETCYLSAAGHNLWRAGLAYETFPFRKVISIEIAV